jgi:hypothetical protein
MNLLACLEIEHMACQPFTYSLLVPGHQTFIHRADASGRPSKILDLQIFAPAEPELLNGKHVATNYRKNYYGNP